MIVQSGLRASLEVTYGTPGLFVQAAVYDNTTGTPTAPFDVAMPELVPGTYVGSFVPVAGKSYVVVKRAFTDGTYTTVDENFPASSEAFQSVDIGSGSGGGGESATGPIITGYVGSAPIVGTVIVPEPITGELPA